MTSLPTISQGLTQADLIYLQNVDPNLFMIKVALDETGVNPVIIPQIIRSLAYLTYGTGYGNIKIFMQARVITQIRPEESIEINKSAVK